MKREMAVIGMVACLAIGIIGGWFIPSPFVITGTRTSLLDTIQTRGTIIIGTSTDYPPFEFVNVTADPPEIVGFDVDVCNWIAEELGVTIVWDDRGFGGLIAACVAGKIDMIAAAMTYTDNRSSYLAASITYITVGQAVIVRNDSALTISSLSDLDGHQTGVQAGTTLYDDLVAAGVSTIKQHISVDALMLDLIGKGVEAAYIDEPVFTAWAKTYDLKIILRTGTEEFALWTRYGEPELLREINQVVHESFLDGRMYDSLNKWFNASI